MSNININDRKRTPYSANGFQNGWHVYDGLYGPWNSFRELVVSINPSLSSYTDEQIENYLKTRPVGLTVGIYENDKVVEYWNPVEGQGFVKKKSSDIVSDYSTAKVLSTSDNAGAIVKVNNSETIDGVTYPAGFYITNGDGTLNLIGNSSNSIMDSLETYTASDEEKEHTYITNVTNKDNQIYPIKKDLDTDKILMSGNDENDNDTFCTVTGTNVGGLKNGEVVTNGTSIKQLIQKLLTNEIDVKIGGYPSVELLYYPSNSIYEVGTKVSGTLFYDFKNGYFVGENEDYDTYQEADCAPKTITYIPTGSYNETIKLGDNKFSVIVKYNASESKPLKNTNELSDVFIPAGTCKDEHIIKGAYKFWYGNIEYDEDILTKEIDDSFFKTLSSLKQGWVDGTNDTKIGECSNGSNQMFCCLCPNDYYLYGEQMTIVAKSSLSNNTYTYTLPDGNTTKEYSLYVWKFVSQRYTNVSVKKK